MDHVAVVVVDVRGGVPVAPRVMSSFAGGGGASDDGVIIRACDGDGGGLLGAWGIVVVGDCVGDDNGLCSPTARLSKLNLLDQRSVLSRRG